MRVFLGLAMTALAALSAHAALAQFIEGDQVITVEAARDMPDETVVRLQGRITSRVDDEEYLFRDATGEVQLWVAPDVWRGVEVSSQDQVEIIGDVDRDLLGTEINVTSVRQLD